MTGLPRTEGSLAGAAPGPADGRPRTPNSTVPAPSADPAQAQATGAKPAVRWYRGLSGQLLLLTILFVMLAEVPIFVPSIARERITCIQRRGALALLGFSSLLVYVRDAWRRQFLL